MTTDVLILGSGVAGLSAAIRAAQLGLSTVVCTKGHLAASATWYAQGGVAAALDDGDSPEMHADDTDRAGAGLCDLDAVAVLVNEGPTRVRELIALGAEFDRAHDADDALAFTREGGHSRARIVHAGGDATGAEIERALVEAVRASATQIYEECFVAELLVRDGRCVGARVIRDGATIDIEASATVLATGGAGQCFAVTTNPWLSTGDGIAIALRAGAALADIEFMQFHPTALDHPAMPRPLLSEALRGEGAILRDIDGTPFMAAVHPMADLAPRDIVARAITERLIAQDVMHVWLDATTIPDFPERFPTVFAACQQVGLDPRVDWLPVAPAAHYLSGGIATDLHGATTLPGLFAVGEVACSGVHGANRLASNSLLDGLVFGPRAAEAIARGITAPEPTGVLRVLDDIGSPRASDADLERASQTAAGFEPPVSTPELDKHIEELRTELQRMMTLHAGVIRDATGLAEAERRLRELQSDPIVNASAIAARELANLVTVAHCLVRAALLRAESRGTHTRGDFPERDDHLRVRFFHVDGACVALPLAPLEATQ